MAPCRYLPFFTSFGSPVVKHIHHSPLPFIELIPSFILILPSLYHYHIHYQITSVDKSPRLSISLIILIHLSIGGISRQALIRPFTPPTIILGPVVKPLHCNLWLGHLIPTPYIITLGPVVTHLHHHLRPSRETPAPLPSALSSYITLSSWARSLNSYTIHHHLRPCR